MSAPAPALGERSRPGPQIIPPDGDHYVRLTNAFMNIPPTPDSRLQRDVWNRLNALNKQKLKGFEKKRRDREQKIQQERQVEQQRKEIEVKKLRKDEQQRKRERERQQRREEREQRLATEPSFRKRIMLRMPWKREGRRLRKPTLHTGCPSWDVRLFLLRRRLENYWSNRKPLYIRFWREGVIFWINRLFRASAFFMWWWQIFVYKAGSKFFGVRIAMLMP